MTLAHLGKLGTSARADAIRFLIAGGLNTLLTFALYQALLFVLPSAYAYLISWGAGIVFVMAAYPNRVFPESRTSLTDRLALGASYVGVFLFGLILLEALTRAGLGPRLGIIVVMAATTAASFLIARMLLRR